MTRADRNLTRLVGYVGEARKFWQAEHKGTTVELRHGEVNAEGKRESKKFSSEVAAGAFLAKQISAYIDRGYHAELPLQILRWAEVRDEVSASLAGNSEDDNDRVFVHEGDLVVPHALWLDYRRGLLSLADQSEDPFTGLIVRGNLTIEGCLFNIEDDYGPFLLVTGNLTAVSVATGGARICICGSLTAETVVTVDVSKSPERATNYIRYWFDNDKIHLEDFYDENQKSYNFQQVLALFGLLLRVVIPTAAPYTTALATFDKQCDDVIRSLNWHGKSIGHVQALFSALEESRAGFERIYPGNALITGLRSIFSKHLPSTPR
jgi:predicted DNA-binding WGR domain protein